jgi:hypothetical protein
MATSHDWPRNPLVYEINTWVLLEEMSRRTGRRIELGDIPAGYWNDISALGFDAVWLMGVWERSPESVCISLADPKLMASFRHALPDFTPADNAGSPYCVRRYVVDGRLGGPEGLARARERLAKAGLRLMLDFVPNHVAPDHPWAAEHAEYFIGGTKDDLSRDPASFIEIGGHVIARGRDPYFPAWPDVLQLNAFDAGLRAAATDTLNYIAAQCDAVRCDMAMLLINKIFQQTWGNRAGPAPASEYWREIIRAVKDGNPGFLFAAEAYWDLEWELQQQGFDYCYDKRLYDRLRDESAEATRLHLVAPLEYQNRLVRFIENHDEPRAASVFPPEKHRAAALASSTLPGMRLFHEGQLEGRRVHLPVFLGRRTEEPVDSDLANFYKSLVQGIKKAGGLRSGWQLMECHGWSDNASNRNLVSWLWTDGASRLLVVVNLSDSQSQGRVPLSQAGAGEGVLRLTDILTSEVFSRNRAELRESGLYVDLKPWGFHALEFTA